MHFTLVLSIASTNLLVTICTLPVIEIILGPIREYQDISQRQRSQRLIEESIMRFQDGCSGGMLFSWCQQVFLLSKESFFLRKQIKPAMTPLQAWKRMDTANIHKFLLEEGKYGRLTLLVLAAFKTSRRCSANFTLSFILNCSNDRAMSKLRMTIFVKPQQTEKNTAEDCIETMNIIKVMHFQNTEKGEDRMHFASFTMWWIRHKNPSWFECSIKLPVEQIWWCLIQDLGPIMISPKFWLV